MVREFVALLKGLNTLVTVREKAVLAEQPLEPPQREVHVTVATMVVSAEFPVDVHALLPTVAVQESAGEG